MGRGLYEQNPVFRACMERMDRVAIELLGTSVLKELYGPQGRGESFDDIRLTHPAIFMVEFALATAVMERGLRPDCTLGASLGTFAALAVAGRLSMEEALALVIRQALAVERHSPRGGMIALLAPVTLYEESNFLQARSVVAGRNFASHFVISVPEANMAAVEAWLARANVAHQTLPVHYPFHAAWIDPLREAFVEACGAGQVRASATPVLCCATGDFLGAVAHDHFWAVAREEISFMPAVARMEALGPCDYLDLGPSGTLGNFLRYLLPAESGSRRFNLMAPFGRDTELLASVVAQLLPGRVPAGVGI
jgi:acyl transferase domain-containing protein